MPSRHLTTRVFRWGPTAKILPRLGTSALGPHLSAPIAVRPASGRPKSAPALWPHWGRPYRLAGHGAGHKVPMRCASPS